MFKSVAGTVVVAGNYFCFCHYLMVDNFAAVLAFNCKINNIIQLNLDLMFFADTYSTRTYNLYELGFKHVSEKAKGGGARA